MTGKDLPHESAQRHVSGKAKFIDDLPSLPDLLFAMPIVSPHAHARIMSMNFESAKAVPGVLAVLTAPDIPGKNECSPVGWGEPLFAEDEVHCVGQYIGLVAGESIAACRAGLASVEIEYSPLPAILDIQQGIREQSFFGEPAHISGGDVETALKDAPIRFSGTVDTGAQEHFYLETQVALAIPGENRSLHVFSSTQHPSEVQEKIAKILGWGRNNVVVTCPRMGGAFGGKESQAAQPAAMASLAAMLTGRPVKIRFEREADICMTGKRHPYHSSFEVGTDLKGKILALKVESYADTGWSPDLSRAVLSRTLFHLDNAYHIPDYHFTGRIVKTNTVSHTAFRGFGGPQGVIVIEEIMNRLSERLGLDPASVRRLNYYSDSPANITPYGQKLENIRISRIHSLLLDSSKYSKRRSRIDAFNRNSDHVKRGIALSPVKFGISFTKKEYNQAGAYVLIYQDGTVQINHGGTEMGQGLHTKMLAVAAATLGISIDRIRVMDTSTDKVPNTSATAASSGADLNGEALRRACETLRERLRPVAAWLLGIVPDEGDGLIFENNRIWLPGKADAHTTFEEVAEAAYNLRIQLFATGYYRTPGINFNPETGRGTPFYYFAYGAAVTEVEVDGLTGQHRILRADILHDVGNSLVPSIDRGQIEGAYIQGAGWLTMEEMLWDDTGRILTSSASTYNIPAIGDAPADFRVSLLKGAPHEGVVYKSKAVGEPPFMLGISVIGALRHAISAFAEESSHKKALNISNEGSSSGDDSIKEAVQSPGTPETVTETGNIECLEGCFEVPLSIPATPEAVLRSISSVREKIRHAVSS